MSNNSKHKAIAHLKYPPLFVPRKYRADMLLAELGGVKWSGPLRLFLACAEEITGQLYKQAFYHRSNLREEAVRIIELAGYPSDDDSWHAQETLGSFCRRCNRAMVAAGLLEEEYQNYGYD